MLLFMGSCNWDSADLETLLGLLLCRHWRNQQVSNWTKVSVMIRTSDILQQEKQHIVKVHHFCSLIESDSFIVHLFQNRQQVG